MWLPVPLYIHVACAVVACVVVAVILSAYAVVVVGAVFGAVIS